MIDFGGLGTLVFILIACEPLVFDQGSFGLD
jgi:hypothetical protein